MPRFGFVLPLGAALLLQLAATAFPAQVEAQFARGLYPRVATGLAALTAPLPFSLGEAGIALVATCVLGAFAALLRRLWRRSGRRRVVLAAAARRLVLLGGIGYAVFLFAWGLNYRRRPFAESGDLTLRPAAAAELVGLARELAADANRWREGRSEDAAGVFRLAAGRDTTFARAPGGSRALAARFPALAGPTPRPKAAFASPILSRLGVAGIYLPFTAEPLVNATLPEAELPFSASHEIAHAQGFAREDEANFVGYLACRLHPDPEFRYSGALIAGFYALAALDFADRSAARKIETLRSEPVRRDIAAIVAWSARYEGPLRQAGERVNDAYLRSQGAREGVRSYGRMVDLLLAESRARTPDVSD